MRALREIQADFCDAVLGGTPGTLLDDVRPSPLSPERRIAVYRNHFLITLTDSLAVTFPVLQTLVGDSFFAQSTRRYASTHPPVSPTLFEYGKSFPDFLAAQAGSEFTYLTDVGAFEWAINHAYHADDASPIGADALAVIPAELRGNIVLAFHPSAQLVTSDYPVLDIWRAHEPGADDATVDLSARGARLLVWRHGIDVVWQRLSDGEFAFTASLLARASLTEACTAALAAESSFDAGATLRYLFAGGVVAGASLAS